MSGLVFTAKLGFDLAQRNKNALEYERTLNQTQLDFITERLKTTENSLKSDGVGIDDLETNPYYNAIKLQQKAYDDNKVRIENEIKMLDEEMKQFDAQMQNGINSKSDLWCFGG